MPNAFLWTLTNGALSRTVILWNKTVMIIVSNPGGRSVRMSAHEDHAHARAEALDYTEVEEGFGLTLGPVIGAKGWSALLDDIAMAHRLYLIGQQQEALLVVAQRVARGIIDTGEVLHHV